MQPNTDITAGPQAGGLHCQIGSLQCEYKSGNRFNNRINKMAMQGEKEIRSFLLSNFEKELTKEMIFFQMNKHISQVQKLGFNFQVTLNNQTTTASFINEFNYKPILKNPIVLEPYLNRKDYLNIRKYFVKNLNEGAPIREKELFDAFKDIARIHKIKLSYKNGECLGYGQIHFNDPEGKSDTKTPIEKTICGRTIALEKYDKEHSSNVVTFQLENLVEKMPDSQEERTKLVTDLKARVASIIPAEIHHNCSVICHDKVICFISVDASNSAKVEELLKTNFQFGIKYGKNRSPFLRLFIGNLKADANAQSLKLTIEKHLAIKILKCELVSKDSATKEKLVSGDLYLTEGEDGKKVITESKRHKEIREFFKDGKVYFNIKLPKKQKDEVKNKSDRYKKAADDIKMEKDKLKAPSMLQNLLSKNLGVMPIPGMPGLSGLAALPNMSTMGLPGMIFNPFKPATVK